jgi:hypothetical protein
MTMQYEFNPLLNGSSRDYEVKARASGGRVAQSDIVHWGAIDEHSHKLRLMVDAGVSGQRISAGSIYLRYCNFTGKFP